MMNTNAVRTEIHYAQVGEYQLPLLTLPQTDDSEPSGQIWPDAAGLSQESASCAVQPDVAERYALAAFAGSPESRLRAGRTHDRGLGRQALPAPDKERSQLLWAAHMNGLKAQAEEVVVTREIVYQ